MTVHCWVNDFPLTSLGIEFETVDGWQDGASLKTPSALIPGVAGVLATGLAAVTAREIVARGAICSRLNGPAGMADVVAKTDRAKLLLGAGLIEVRFLDRVDRYFLAQLSDWQASAPAKMQFGRNGWVRSIELRFLCEQFPRGYDRSGLTIGLPYNTPVSLLLGSAPSAALIRIFSPAGSVTNPVLTYRDIAGNARASLTLTQVLGQSTDYLEVNMDTKVITRSLSGVVTGPVPIAAGDFFALDPADGDQVNAIGPTLAVTASAGSPTAVVMYRRAYQ